jgi:hypothetical protein
MTTRPLSAAQDNFNRILTVFHALEKSSTRSNAAVQTLFAHLQTCVAHLFVWETSPYDQDALPHLKARDNWRDDYYTLMLMVTAELKTTYDQYESANSGGLPYDMYERFVNVLRRCRSWMKQTEVVLISKEDYARRTPVQTPVIRQEVGAQRGHESAALSTLQQEVRDLKVKLTTDIAQRGHESLSLSTLHQEVRDLKHSSLIRWKFTRIGRKKQLTSLKFTRPSQPSRLGWPPSSNTHQQSHGSKHTRHLTIRCQPLKPQSRNYSPGSPR